MQTAILWHIVQQSGNSVVCHMLSICIASANPALDSMHLSGVGQLQSRSCDVKYDLYIPRDWRRFPFYMLVSRGSHSHAPPPPTKLPYEIGQQIAEAINAQDILGLTARKLMISPTFANIIRTHGDTALRYIHRSLHIEDRVTALIHKQRLLSYPQGTSIAGVWREFQFEQLKSCDDQWIREVHFFDEDHEHYLIICCTYEQAKLFQDVRHIEMDLAFKMVQGKTNVFTMSGWNERAGRKTSTSYLYLHYTNLSIELNTYLYAFMNLETRVSYKVLFEKAFKILGNIGREPIKWAYQLGSDDSCEGIRTITVDMCKKQAPGRLCICLAYVKPMLTRIGLGDYLATLDPRMSWSEHLEYVLILCETHVQRAFKKKFNNHEATSVIPLIFNARSKAEVLAIMDSTSAKWPETKHWFQNKMTSWVLAGITSEASKIPIHWWKLAPHHTGISESSHYRDNEAVGRKQALLTAIIRCVYLIYKEYI
jgi:hypothetical protein